jgi:hypothetical protein
MAIKKRCSIGEDLLQTYPNLKPLDKMYTIVRYHKQPSVWIRGESEDTIYRDIFYFHFCT